MKEKLLPTQSAPIILSIHCIGFVCGLMGLIKKNINISMSELTPFIVLVLFMGLIKKSANDNE